MDETNITAEEKQSMIELVKSQFPQALANAAESLAEAERHRAPSSFHYSELEKADPNEPLGREWNTYLREVGGLVARGDEGKFALIKGDVVFGVFETMDAARDEGHRRFGLEAFMTQPILEYEPNLRVRGINLPWPNSAIPLRKLA